MYIHGKHKQHISYLWKLEVRQPKTLIKFGVQLKVARGEYLGSYTPQDQVHTPPGPGTPSGTDNGFAKILCDLFHW